MKVTLSIRLTLKSMADMRTRVIIAALAAVAALAACSRSEMRFPAVKDVPAVDNLFSTKNAVRRISGTLSREGLSTLPGGAVMTASLDEDETRVHLGSGTTQAPVLWDAGDYFWTFAIDPSSNEVTYAPYQTSAGGSSASFTALGGLPEANAFYHLKVLEDYIIGWADLTEYDLGIVFGITIPDQQTAVADNVDPDAFVSGTVSASASGEVSFKNAMSLLRFKLSGDIVSSVKKITIRGTTSIAGDTGLYYVDGVPYADFELGANLGLDGGTREITLSGDFVKDKYYYIALGPGEQSGLIMTFSDGDTGSTTKLVSKKLNFQRGRITDFGTINLGDAFSDEPVGDVAELYMSATATVTKPVTIVVVPDGFTQSELNDYKLQAHAGIDALFATEPFKTYKSYFNVWLLYVASAESGASITDGNGNIETYVNCYFGSRWGESSYGDMDLDETVLYNFVTANCPDLADNSHSVTETPVLVIINDSRYGGICHSYSSGKAYCQAPLTSGTIGWGYPDITAVNDTLASEGTRAVTAADLVEIGTNYSGDWRNTLVHEFGGHAFGRLGDEYWYDQAKSAVSAISGHSWPVPMSLNISAKFDPTPWTTDLLSRRVSLVTSNPLYARLGVFQGGDVSSLNRWRSERISCMIDNRMYFSAWQRYLIVKRIMTLAGTTFNLADFLSHDDPTDPIRDAVSSGVMNPAGDRSADFAPIMPPLPPPVLRED